MALGCGILHGGSVSENDKRRLDSRSMSVFTRPVPIKTIPRLTVSSAEIARKIPPGSHVKACTKGKQLSFIVSLVLALTIFPASAVHVQKPEPQVWSFRERTFMCSSDYQ